MLYFILVLSVVLLLGFLLLLFLYHKKENVEKQSSGVEENVSEAKDLFSQIKMEEKETIQPVEDSRYGELLSDPEKMETNKMYAKETRESDKVTLAFGGDILFDDNYSIMSVLKQRGGDIATSFSSDLLEEMRAADIFMVNNEFTYTTRGEPIPEKQYTFRANPEKAEWLNEMGVDVVSLANNHAYDYGEISLLDTIEALNHANVPYVGAGENLEEAARAVTFIANDMKIAIVSATQIERLDNPDTKGATENSPGVFRCWNPEKLYQVIEETQEESDFVIVYIHWGTEGTAELDWAQSTQVTEIVESGADLVIGDHPHCLQEMSYVNGVPVIYSIGNFLFNSKTQDTCLIKIEITENGLHQFQFLPAIQENCATRLAEGEEKNRILEYMRGISDNVTIDDEGIIAPK